MVTTSAAAVLYFHLNWYYMSVSLSSCGCFNGAKRDEMFGLTTNCSFLCIFIHMNVIVAYRVLAGLGITAAL